MNFAFHSPVAFHLFPQTELHRSREQFHHEQGHSLRCDSMHRLQVV
jgi:hypothetical protein